MRLSLGFVISIGLLFPYHVQAQSDSLGNIRGITVADSTNGPLEFVNVLLFHAPDSVLATGTTSDSVGRFELKNVPWGGYFVQCNLVGYQARTTGFFHIDAQHRRLNLGTLWMRATTVNMEEVTITADKSPFTSSIDRMVYNVDQDVLSKAASASELLENIPSVQIDLNGEVSLRGSTRVLMMINGKRSPVLEKQEGTFLEQLPASSIERIEVITTPSARYRAQGKSGIINIVLKKDTPLGTHGNLTAHVGNDGRYNGSARVNHSPGNFNVYGSYSVRRDNRDRVNSDIRSEATRAAPTTVSSIYTDTLYSFANPMTQTMTVGFDYHFDSLNSVGLSGNYFQNTFSRTDNSLRSLEDATGVVLTEYKRNDSGNENDQEYGVTINYHHNFSRKDHKVRVEAAASRSPENDDYRFTNIYVSPTFPNAYDNSFIGQRDDRSHVAIDYSNALDAKSSLEAGYTGERNRTDLNYSAENFDPILQQFFVDTVKTSRYSYEESVHSLYVTYKRSFGRFGMLGGFRIERTSGTSDLQRLDSIISTSYWNIFPSLHLSYFLTKSAELKLSYSRRISRPKARDLNPFAEYRDPKNISYGNPQLVPEYTHSVELGCQFQDNRIFVFPSIFYRYTSNDISPIKQFVNRSTLQTTKQNVFSNQTAGLEVIFSWRLGDLFSTRVSTTGLSEQLDATNIGNGQYKSHVSWSGTLSATLNIARDTKFEVHSHFSTMRLIPQGERFPSSVVNLGLRQELAGGKLSLTATVSDIFKGLKRHNDIDIPRLQQTVFNTRDSRVFYVGFTYRLGTTPKKLKEEEFRYEEDDE